MSRKIPTEAKRVFQGLIFDVYQWEQELFDGSYTTFERLKRADTVTVIATSGDKVYLTHQSQPTKPDYYGLLGGRVDAGEEPLEAAKRELLEESGMVSENWELYKTYEPVHKIDWKIYTYIARDCRKVSDQKLDPGEKIEVVECSFDEFIAKTLSEKSWDTELQLDIYRMKEQGTLDTFKKKIFTSK